MNRRRWCLYGALPFGALVLTGCHHCGSQSCYPPAPVVRSAGILPAHPLTPCQSCPAPPAATLYPAGPLPQAGSNFQPMPPGPLQQAWGPASPPGVNLGGPVPVPSEESRESARIRPPESEEPPRAGNPEKATPTPRLPVGIANFTPVISGVASGLRPLVDGVDWLKNNDYKTAVQIRTPGENGDGDRNLFELRGLKYITLEVSPRTLTPRLVDEFNKIVADPTNRPLFVYDKDGSLAGALWYLHFRTVDKMSDEQARKQAAPLGLKENAEGPQGELWLAIQKYLAEQK
jgi:hypothetical protein